MQYRRQRKYGIHIRTLKQELNHGLILKSVHRVIQFNQKASLKPYIDMNPKLRKEVKNEFEKDFFKLMNNSVFGKTMENARNHRDIKLVTTEEKRSKLVSEPNYHTTKHFSENLLVIEMKKTKAKMNKAVYLGMSILDICKTLMYEFWYDYIKPKYGDKAKLCYMDTDNFVIDILTEDFNTGIANDVEGWFDTSNYDENKTGKRPLLISMNKKVIGLFKDELGGTIMTEFVGIRPNTYSYLINGYDCCYDKEKIINKKAKKQTFKSDHHDVYTVKNNKIVLSSNDDKRLQTFDRITTYPHGTNTFKVCESKNLKIMQSKSDN